MSRHDEDSSTAPRPRAGGESPTTRAFLVRVEKGEDKGATATLAEGLPVLVGKSHACDLRLSDPQVSRRHLVLEGRDGQIRLTDLGSGNGTFVNGVRVGVAYLTGGEQLELGQTLLRVEPADRVAVPPGSTATRFGRMIGESEEIRRVFAKAEKLAKAEATIVLEGESGTGKEALAEALHEASSRASGPFIVFDCTSVPPHLVESELFGHEPGAFAGAQAERPGLFEQAKGGTLLIDEIGDLDLPLQPKLLRALERGEVRRLGGTRWIPVDVRIIAATRRDLDRAVQEGRFRDDLFFRLAVARIELPPLRARRGDVGALARHFWRELGGEGDASYELLERLERHDWPGNVRELRAAVVRHLALGGTAADDPTLGPARGDTEPLAAILARDLPYPRARQLAQAEFERRYIERVLAQHGGNIARAAASSGIARRYFNVILARRRDPR